jgi:hypothetical protein
MTKLKSSMGQIRRTTSNLYFLRGAICYKVTRITDKRANAKGFIDLKADLFYQ